MTDPVAGELIDGAARTLQSAGVASPRHDAEVLLAHVLGGEPARLDKACIISGRDAQQFERLVDRRAAREPLQHLTGSTGFRYLELAVGPGVFTPRPETEVMTGVAIEELHRLAAGALDGPIRAVDLCAGSGAIGLAVVTEQPGVLLTAVEISADACAYAARNADAALGRGSERARYELRNGDIADAVDDLAGLVHVVVANPPYIPLEAYESVAPEARDFDPPVALWSGEDGLDAIRVVADVAARLLVDDGLVLCEHADVQGRSAADVFSASGAWAQVRDHPDLTGRARYVSARRVSRRGVPAGTMDS